MLVEINTKDWSPELKQKYSEILKSRSGEPFDSDEFCDYYKNYCFYYDNVLSKTNSKEEYKITTDNDSILPVIAKINNTELFINAPTIAARLKIEQLNDFIFNKKLIEHDDYNIFIAYILCYAKDKNKLGLLINNNHRVWINIINEFKENLTCSEDELTNCINNVYEGLVYSKDLLEEMEDKYNNKKEDLKKK